MGTKKCRCCKKTKSIKNFDKNALMADGLTIYCKPCKSAKQKKYRLERKEHYKGKEKEYRIRYVDRIAAYQEEYYSRPDIIKKTAAYHKAYKKKNKEKLKKYMADYNKKNKEMKSKKALEFYYKNKEAILKKRKEKRDVEKKANILSGKTSKVKNSNSRQPYISNKYR